MEKTRVKNGERYWSVRIFAGIMETFSLMELEQSVDDTTFNSGNYFHTREEAEQAADKLRAVLKGADVIEMPSEVELEHKAVDIAMERICFGECYDAVVDMVKFLKSKIVK